VSGALAEVDLISGTPVWNNTGRLTIGDAGSPVASRWSCGPGHERRIAHRRRPPSARGEAIVGGPGTWHAGDPRLGFGGGTATLEIRDDGHVTSDAASVGVTSDASVTLTHGGWTSGNLAVGRGRPRARSRSRTARSSSATDAFIGFESTPGSSVTVDGTGAEFDHQLEVLGRLVVGAGPLQQPEATSFPTPC
jgi:T5SS/PEP-CTERM-associated repeat protein